MTTHKTTPRIGADDGAKRPAQARSALDSDGAVVIVCRGGDCGSRRKHPTVDHATQLAFIRIAVGDAADVLVSKCLDACEHSNVIVVVPNAHDRDRGVEPVWVGEVNDPDVTDDLTGWVKSPTLWSTPPPTLVDIHTFIPTRRSRHELADPDTVPAARGTRHSRKRR